MGPGRDLQGGDSVVAFVRQQDLSGEGGDAQGHRGFPPPGGTTDHRADSEMWGRWRVVVPPGSGGNGSCEDPPHRVVH